MSETQSKNETAQSSSGGGLKWVFIVLGGLLLVSVCCGVSCIYSFYSGFGSLAGALNKPVEDLVAELNANAEVTGKLGSPLKQVPFSETGKYKSNISNNNAEVELVVRGPNGRATASGEMTYVGDTWKATNILLEFDDGSQMTLGN